MAMKVIQMARQGGKTTALIRACAKHRYALIVCHSHREAQRVFAHAREIGSEIPMPITYDEFMRHTHHGQHVEAFYLDNADLFLQSLTTVPIVAISVDVEALTAPATMHTRGG